MPIRVVRIMEYTYPTAHHMESDMALWQVQRQKVIGHNWTIRSTTLPLEVWEEIEGE